MSKAKVVVRKGRRYVKVGKRLIKVDKGISERELVMWLVKHFHPKKKARRKTKAKGDIQFTAKQSDIDSLRARSEITLAADAARQHAKEAKDQVQELQAQIKEQKAEVKHLQLAEGKEKIFDMDDANQFHREATMRIQEKKDEIKLLEGEVQTHRKQLEDQMEMSEQLQVINVDAKRIFKQLSALRNDREQLNGAMLAKASAAVQKQIDAYTVADLLKIADMDKATFKQLEYNKELLLNELLANKKINRLKMIEELHFHDKRYDELGKLEDDIAKLEAELDYMVGKGKGLDQGMSEDEIRQVMGGSHNFLGVFAADEMVDVQKLAKKNSLCCWIMNTDPRGKPGQHWVAFLIDARPHGSHSVEYYDPLANPIPRPWMDDLKMVMRAVNVSDIYLRFKENTIADQNNTSSNCGEFSCHFLLARLAGESFGEASGWNKAGEKEIEQWKKGEPTLSQATKKMWIGNQKGEGLRNIWDKVRKTATKVIQRIKDTLGGPRGGPSPAVRGWLAEYGQVPIERIMVCKKPVHSIIMKLGNWLTQGKLNENMDRLGYDQMMHIFMIIRLKNGMSVKCEKNQVVVINSSTDVGRESRPVPVEKGATMQMHFDAADKAHGEALWKYNIVTQNCQKFVLWFLGNPSESVRKFIEQDVESVLKDMGLIERAATAVVDLAATADVALNGRGDAAHAPLIY